jgi:hypothetical protein
MKSFKRQKVDVNRLPPLIIQKWSGAVLNEGFVPFPKRLLRCLHRVFDGPDAAKELAVVLAVADFNRPKLTRFPSLAFLSFVAGLPEPEVKVILGHLKQKSYIEISGDFDELDINLDGLLKIIETETKE